MTLEHIYYISQTIAVVVITATLIALFYQGYQTNKIARAELTLSMWMQTGAMQYSLFDSPEKAEFMHRALSGSAPLSEAEKIRFNTAISVGIGVHAAAFNLRERGLVESAAYEGTASSTKAYMASARVRRWWSLHRMGGYAAAFRAIVDAIAAEYEGAPSPVQEKQN
ncbi:MAG TPA: hypothetical protein VNH64_00200 [Parvularculaceae bacterium]|nr:hypothetical protein [Parvularculaceae bacterium]